MVCNMLEILRNLMYAIVGVTKFQVIQRMSNAPGIILN